MFAEISALAWLRGSLRMVNQVVVVFGFSDGESVGEIGSPYKEKGSELISSMHTVAKSNAKNLLDNEVVFIFSLIIIVKLS